MVGIMRFDVPNLTLLRQFVVAAEEGGISKAANRLRISQPALSKNIRKLEELLGTPLFERHSKGTTLTPAGQIFHERAQIIGLEYQHALQDVRNSLSEQASTIRIGAGPIWSSTILPRMVQRFHASFPRHRLQVLTGSADDLAEWVRIGRIDIFAGVVTHRTTPPGFVVRKLARSQMVVLAAHDHPLIINGAATDPKEVTKYPFVAFVPAQEVLQVLTRYLKSQGAEPPHFMLETSSIYACIELVRSGNFLIYETRMLAENPIGEALEIVPLGDHKHEFDLGIIHRDGLERIPVYRNLMQIMRDELTSTISTDA